MPNGYQTHVLLTETLTHFVFLQSRAECATLSYGTLYVGFMNFVTHAAHFLMSHEVCCLKNIYIITIIHSSWNPELMMALNETLGEH